MHFYEEQVSMSAPTPNAVRFAFIVADTEAPFLHLSAGPV